MNKNKTRFLSKTWGQHRNCLKEEANKIDRHYKLKPSFSIIKDEKEKDKVGVGDKSIVSIQNI